MYCFDNIDEPQFKVGIANDTHKTVSFFTVQYLQKICSGGRIWIDWHEILLQPPTTFQLGIHCSYHPVNQTKLIISLLSPYLGFVNRRVNTKKQKDQVVVFLAISSY